MTDKPFGVSYSKMSSFRRCKRRFHWQYMDKYYPPSTIGQVRGSAGHAALAVWHVEYNADKAMQAAWDKWAMEGQADGEEWLLLENSLNRYFVWSAEHDTFKLLEAEKKFDILYRVGDREVILTGFIDWQRAEGKKDPPFDGWNLTLCDKMYGRQNIIKVGYVTFSDELVLPFQNLHYDYQTENEVYMVACGGQLEAFVNGKRVWLCCINR